MKKCYSIPGITEFNLEEHVDIWSDGTIVYYGYQTPEDEKALIWGRTVSFGAQITPAGYPAKNHRPKAKQSAGAKSPPLSPEQDAKVKKWRKMIRQLEKLVLPKPDPAMELEYQDYYDAKSFYELAVQLAAIRREQGPLTAEKCQRAAQPLREMFAIIRNIKLPDHLMRDDSKFAILLTQLFGMAETISKAAAETGTALPAEAGGLRDFLDSFLDELIAAGNHKQGIERSMTADEEKRESELRDLIYEYDTPLRDKLAALKELGENPLLYPEDRIEYLSAAIELTPKETASASGEEELPYIPGLEEHIALIARQLRQLEKDGETFWTDRIAEQFLENANIWREGADDLPELTKAEFAALVYLEAVSISTAEKDGKPTGVMEVYFQDKEDSQAGHSMYARVIDGEVVEYNLLG